VLATALALVLAAGHPAALHFTSLSQRAFQGKEAVAVVAVRPAGVRCTLTVRYANAALQPGLKPVRATRGRAAWTWRVPEGAATGAAQVTAACGGAQASRTLTVVGSVIPPRVSVGKDGFSIRPKASGGTDVSYGLVLHNDSPTRDALSVTVLVNFVDPNNVLFGSATTNVAVISAGSTYDLGGMLSFPGAAPVARLEVVIQVASHVPHALRLPAVENIRVVQSTYDPGWVGSVEGELTNGAQGQILQNAQLSAVVFDALGNVIGGGSGYAFASLPPGTREFFKADLGFSAIPFEKAVSAQVSLVPTYKPVGS
jgi:hypothetical protein